MLIERVVVATRGRTEVVDVTIHWVGGLQTRHEIRRPVLSYEQLSDYDSMRGRVFELHGQGHTAGEIAAVLNGAGYQPLHGKSRQIDDTARVPRSEAIGVRSECGGGLGRRRRRRSTT